LCLLNFFTFLFFPPSIKDDKKNKWERTAYCCRLREEEYWLSMVSRNFVIDLFFLLCCFYNKKPK
jgi:hypothetical protein